MIFVLEDGEQIEGHIEWYDRNAIKVRQRRRARSFTKPASNICIRRRINGKRASTGGFEQPVANGNAEALVFRQWANDDGCPGCIQFPQSGKQAPGKLLLIRQIAPLINQVGALRWRVAGQHDADRLACGVQFRGKAQ